MSDFDDLDFDFDFDFDEVDNDFGFEPQPIPATPRQIMNFLLAGTGLNFALSIAVATIFVASFCLCRRMGDKARNVVTWMKVSLLFFGLSVFVLGIGNLLNYFHLNNDFPFGAVNLTSYIGGLFRIIAAAIVLRLLASFGMGILYARATGQPQRMATPVRAVATAAMALLILLGVVYFALGLATQFGGYSTQRLWLPLNRLYVAIYALLFVGSVLALGASVFVRVKTVKSHPTLKSACLIYIACAFLFFVSNLFQIIRCGLFVITGNDFKPAQPAYIVIVSFFFEALPIFLILALVFHLTRSKGRGLWSVTGGANPATAAHYSMQPGQYGQQPVPGQGYVYAQPPQPNMAQQGWQPQMYYYPQQQYPQPGAQPIPQQQMPMQQQQVPMQQQQVPMQQQQVPMQQQQVPMQQQQVPQAVPGQQAPAQAILQQYSQHPVVPGAAAHPGTVPSPLSYDQTGSSVPTQTTGAPINSNASEMDQGIKRQ